MEEGVPGICFVADRRTRLFAKADGHHFHNTAFIRTSETCVWFNSSLSHKTGFLGIKLPSRNQILHACRIIPAAQTMIQI